MEEERSSITEDEVFAIFNAIFNFPSGHPTQEDYASVNTLLQPYIDNGRYDSLMSAYFEPLEENVEGTNNSQETKVRRGGITPPVYAYLTGKYDLLATFRALSTHPEILYNTVDYYNYSFADYVYENKDFEFYLQIQRDGATLYAYSSLGEGILAEPGNNKRSFEDEFKKHIRHTNENYRKILNIVTRRKSKYRAPAGFHGTIILPPGAKETPLESRKIIRKENDPSAFALSRSHRYGPDKHLLIPLTIGPLRSWINAQKQYILSDPRIIYHIKSYTYLGDVFANAYLRGTLYTDTGELQNNIQRTYDSIVHTALALPPFVYQILDIYDTIAKYNENVHLPPKNTLVGKNGKLIIEPLNAFFREHSAFFTTREILLPLLKAYVKEMTTILYNAPRLPRNIIVYRGATKEFEVPKGAREYTSRSFLSTSLHPHGASNFAGELYPTLKCCMYEINISKIIPVLYIGALSEFKTEYELLLPPLINMESSDKLIVKRIVGYDERILVREMTAKGVRATLSATRRKSKSKSKKPLGGAGGPSRSRRSSS